METMYEVSVTQYVRPDGRKRLVTTRLPEETKELFDDMILEGWFFETEQIMTGMISTTISNNDIDLDSEVTPNGPEVQDGMVRMLKRQLWKRKPKKVNIP